MQTAKIQSDIAPSALSDLGGKYMTFQLANEVYGVGILDVREIIKMMRVTRMPRAPSYMRGVINLRGKIIPVLDLRLQFGMPACEDTDQTVIIVVHCEVNGRPLTMGVLVDQVLEVLKIDAEHVEPAPDFGARGARESLILGVGKAADRVVFLLDIARVLSVEEAKALDNSVAQT